MVGVVGGDLAVGGHVDFGEGAECPDAAGWFEDDSGRGGGVLGELVGGGADHGFPGVEVCLGEGHGAEADVGTVCE